MTDADNKSIDGEVLGNGRDVDGAESAIPPQDGAPNNWLALISNYTERPDLFLAEVEKHDPGFVARMNKDSQERAERTEGARFVFSKRQAYTSLALALGAGIVIIATIAIVAIKGAGFWQIMALGVVFAITQGGSLGFEKIIEALAHLMGRAPKQ